MASMKILMQGLPFKMDVASLGLGTVALIQDGSNVLIDTGHWGNRRHIKDTLKSFNLTPSDIDEVILTHSHWDHSLNLDLFHKAIVLINSKELDHVKSVTDDDWATPTAIRKILEEMEIKTTTGVQKISQDITVIETPGHSPGHQAVLVKTQEENILFTGDAMPTLRSYYRELPDYVATTEEECRRSIHRLKELKPSIYYPGHDRPFKNVDGKTVYISDAKAEIIFRKETEEDFRIVLGTGEPAKPEKV